MKCLIGYTGFVGGNIAAQKDFDEKYNSKNITEIRHKDFDLLVCAGITAVKWKANQFPEEDLQAINALLEHLKNIKAKKFVLISTVDVYKNPIDVDEDTELELNDLGGYGLNRIYVENFVRENFEDYLIIRLPGLFGDSLKKNFIYDMIHQNALDWTHYKSVFQFYDLSNIWRDINIALQNDIKLLNITSEPVSAEEIARECFGTDFKNDNGKEPVYYDMRSKYADIYGGFNGYLYSKEQVLGQIKTFLKKFDMEGMK